MIADWAPVQEWHRVVSDKDIDAARGAVAGDVVIGGPKGEATGVGVCDRVAAALRFDDLHQALVAATG